MSEIDSLHQVIFIFVLQAFRKVVHSACQSALSPERAELIDLPWDEAQRGDALNQSAEVALPYLR